jgi:hypothetical protein
VEALDASFSSAKIKMTPTFPLRALVIACAGLVFPLQGCGGGSDSGVDTTGSRLSVFDLRGREPRNTKDRSNEKITVDGAAVKVDTDGAATSVDTGPARMEIFYGGVEVEKGLSGSTRRFGQDIIGLETFGDVETQWGRHLDAIGGTEDSFAAKVQTTWNGTVFETNSGRLTLRNMDGAGGSGLNYATYGYWNAEFASFDRLVAFTIADRTVETTLPALGSATYRGGMTGLYLPGFDERTRAASGKASLTVDFISKTVSGIITNVTAGGASLRNVSLESTALSGTTFTGATTTADSGTGPEMNGAYSGGLYGPGASEAVAAFGLSGANGEALVGGFAAKR